MCGCTWMEKSELEWDNCYIWICPRCGNQQEGYRRYK
jgi:hypothetical protein